MARERFRGPVCVNRDATVRFVELSNIYSINAAHAAHCSGLWLFSTTKYQQAVLCLGGEGLPAFPRIN
jgi:hypothetical protein